MSIPIYSPVGDQPLPPKNSGSRYLLALVEAIVLLLPTFYALYAVFPFLFPGGPDLDDNDWEGVCVARVRILLLTMHALMRYFRF